jgi:RNA polymerase sigma-70 factor, ECF subfamily
VTDLVPSADSIATRRFSANHKSAEMTEQSLLARVGTGDRSALHQLYVRYFPCLAKFIENVTLRPDDVEDLVNDTMFEVWKAGESIRTDTSVWLAIMRVAYSRVRRYLADERAHEPLRHVNDSEESKSSSASTTPTDLRIFLSKLPTEERAVLHLVYASGCSRRETADVMKMGCASVDFLLSDVRARARLFYGAGSVPTAEIDTR